MQMQNSFTVCKTLVFLSGVRQFFKQYSHASRTQTSIFKLNFVFLTLENYLLIAKLLVLMLFVCFTYLQQLKGTILLQKTGFKFPTIFSSTCACADVFPRCWFLNSHIPSTMWSLTCAVLKGYCCVQCMHAVYDKR